MNRIVKTVLCLLIICLLLASCQASKHPDALHSGAETTAPVQQTQSTEATQTDPTQTNPPETKPRDPNKPYCSATLDDYFSDHEIIVIIDQSWYEKAYTVEDFSEIGCIGIEDISDQEDYAPMLSYQYRTFVLTLQSDSKQSVLDAIRYLELREDMYFVDVKYVLPSGDTPEVLLEIAIRKAFCALRGKDYESVGHKLTVEYLGQYADAYAVFVDGLGGYSAAIGNVTVYDYEFIFSSSSREIVIYKDGTCFNLLDIEEKEVMTREEVKELWEYYKTSDEYAYLYE